MKTAKLHYRKTGTGAPLLLLHGNGEDHTIFDPLVEVLKDNFEVYAIDSRNHGKSEKSSDYSYDAMVEDIHTFIQTHDIQKPSIVGFSDGAIIALMLELKYPQTFSKMACLGVNLQPSDFLPYILNELKIEFQRTGNPLLKLMLEEPNIELNSLKQIQCPTLIVFAENELFNKEIYQRMMEVMSNAKLLEMKGHEHDSYIVNTPILYKDLEQFFID